ncbi:ankyrin repeat domain-containing protein [Rhodoferax sp.]|uniref:ankyrin repeat domain-containing protein n=1 Tax=Rhodoferax sp. TaxID=50421 RepID=UPI0026311D31|nr:ankyrin repeat domain-containing protein [Rhodoferax sp.]MDD2918354.1 ankyrin repeat domain-containing protein [Rhodoferax sp.]
MKHPLLEGLGADYPTYLEQHHDRLLIKIDELWDTPEIDDYLSDLLIDKRGGRKGFAPDAVKELNALREYRMLETFLAVERKEIAIQELEKRGIFRSRAGFLRAVEDGDVEVTDLFIRANFNIHQTDDNGTPLLLLALKKGFTIMAKMLLNAGADVNEKDKLGLTPLMVACGKSTVGYKDVAEMLIRKGAHINVRDPMGYTPLLLALSGGTIDIAELLINRGADITARTRKGDTPLSLAQNAQCAEIVDLLISKGAKS